MAFAAHEASGSGRKGHRYLDLVGLPVGEKNGMNEQEGKRISQRKLDANRANGTKSQGPKTQRGKDRSRWNALTNGASAKELFILGGKHRPEYERFHTIAHELQEQLADEAYIEDQMLVQKFVRDAWRLELLTNQELRFASDDGAPAYAEAMPHAARHVANAERSFERSYEQVRKIRLRAEPIEVAEADQESEFLTDATRDEDAPELSHEQAVPDPAVPATSSETASACPTADVIEEQGSDRPGEG